MHMSEGVYEKVLAMVGEEAGPFLAPDEVNKPMIRHWCEAIQDGNPLYSDMEYAKESKYGGIIAPPQMVQAFCMAPLWPKRERNDPMGKAVQMMMDAGYSGVVATTTTQEYFRPMRLGDQLSFTLKFVSVSPEKTTRLGTGHFLTSEYTYRNQDGEVVCIQPFTVLMFKPQL
ncbi:MAG: MaoC family dehydratase N-terminal domain-containing protein [Dehalococcoidia bacterium]|nr:MAG: MaoC family dehydratase N-terminal domain-containing protein [Dehalococcoidia bacterium]UCG84680.1 MAG: MaoC family dehydratase N-terminal domain-containing protein [Dehalococcoidia bacterium]